MGSYNYEALHKHTPSIQRKWIPDPFPTNHSGYNNGTRAVQEPYANDIRTQESYANGMRAIQESYINGLRTIQEPYVNGMRAIQEPYVNGIRAVQEPYVNDMRAVQEPYVNGLDSIQDPHVNGYRNALQDRILLAQTAQAHAQAQVQAQMLNGINHYRLTKYNLPTEPSLSVGLLPPNHLEDVVGEMDNYIANNVYANGLSIRRPLFLPKREPRRERRVRKAIVRELEPVRELSTSQSPAHIPEATAEPSLAGMIFGCTSDTYIECMQMKLFALPAANKTEVLRVVPGTKLFLYNYHARELSGIFEATSHGEMDLEPNAFQGFFPAQVRVRCVEKCPNLPLKAFKEAMSENFEKKNKFKYSLNDVQVRKLVTLFRQELKYWKKQRIQQERKIMSSGLQPGLRPGYPSRNEINLLRHLQSDRVPFFQAGKRVRIF